MTKVLIVEDELDIIELISFHLKKEGFQVRFTSNGEDTLGLKPSQLPDLILLDLMLPGLDGLEICKQLKSNPVTQVIPIIMISAKSEESDIVTGLELGADDYVTKPFSPKILISRIKSVLKRSQYQPTKDAPVKYKGLTIIPSKREVFFDQLSIQLTFSEFETLYLLASNPGRVFTRYQIVEEVHGHDYAVTDRTIDVLIVGLRKKMPDSSLIETIRGVGYRFKE